MICMDLLIIGGVAVLVMAMIWLLWPIVIGAPWVPTSMNAVHGMLELANVHKDDIVIDLGSGDGRIIISAAKDYKAKAIGIEADPLRLLWSRWNIQRHGLSAQVKVLWGNFFDTQLGDATVVTIYQSPGINDKLKPKLKRELRPGTRVVTHDFIFDRWKLSKVDAESNNYLYIM
jgi:cyclopropane fatty-acyl-phospholipid synthase-like methyltransferase